MLKFMTTKLNYNSGLLLAFVNLKEIIILIFFISLYFSTQAVAAEKKVALIIGNSDYRNVPALENPKNDASDIATSLKKIGFDVHLETNLTVERMLFVLRDFARTSANADLAIVYYGGHGVEVNGGNYLIPVDATLEKDSDVQFEAIPLDLLINSISQTKGIKLVLLDACRDNPFKSFSNNSSGIRASSRGLPNISSGAGLLVAYSAKDGTVALDGDGRNSPYAKAILKYLGEPGLELNKFFRLVRDEVLTSTNGVQEPFTYGSLPSKDYYFIKKEAIDPMIIADETYWNAINESNSLDLINSYLLKFPNGKYSLEARNKIASLVSGNNQKIEEENKLAEQAAKVEAERKLAEQAAKVEADRKLAEQAAKAEADRKLAEQAAKAEADRKLAEQAAKVEAERKLAEQAAKAEADRKLAEQSIKTSDEKVSDSQSSNFTIAALNPNINVQSNSAFIRNEMESQKDSNGDKNIILSITKRLRELKCYKGEDTILWNEGLSDAINLLVKNGNLKWIEKKPSIALLSKLENIKNVNCFNNKPILAKKVEVKENKKINQITDMQSKQIENKPIVEDKTQQDMHVLILP